jgi:hypothetical protein
MTRRRRFAYQGAFSDMRGLHAAVMDASELLLYLHTALSESNLLDVPIGVAQWRVLTAREVLTALELSAQVFADAAAIVDRVNQARDQCRLMLRAADAADSEETFTYWLQMFALVSRIASGRAPVPREVLSAAQVIVRAHQRKTADEEKQHQL